MTTYWRNGELDDPAGTGVTVYARESNGWLQVKSDNLGYMPQEINKAEYDQWVERIANPDMATYFPGVFPGVGVVSAAIYAQLRDAAQQRWRNAQRVTPRQAREWLILNDLDEKMEAGILTLGDTGKPEDVKRSKLMWNWYENASEWAYGNPQLQAAFSALGIDRDEFFAEARKL